LIKNKNASSCTFEIMEYICSQCLFEVITVFYERIDSFQQELVQNYDTSNESLCKQIIVDLLLCEHILKYLKSNYASFSHLDFTPLLVYVKTSASKLQSHIIIDDNELEQSFGALAVNSINIITLFLPTKKVLTKFDTMEFSSRGNHIDDQNVVTAEVFMESAYQRFKILPLPLYKKTMF
jgi:hypothetical protein